MLKCYNCDTVSSRNGMQDNINAIEIKDKYIRLNIIRLLSVPNLELLA